MRFVFLVAFLHKRAQKILSKAVQRIRYFGLQATKNTNRLRYFVSKAVGNLYLPERIEKEAENKTEENQGTKRIVLYQELITIWWGKDPFKCRNCGASMELARVWQRGKGFVFSIFKNLFGKDIGPPGLMPEIALSSF